MVTDLNKTIVNDTFNHAYNEKQFKLFIKDLLSDANFSAEKVHNIQLPNSYTDFIKSAKRLCKYKYTADEFGTEKVIDVLVVKLKRTTSIERARTAQRNFVARYLNGGRNYPKDAALVAFISEDASGKISPDWRFSFVEMNYVTEIIESEDGQQKRKAVPELTPAKRFSFLVGENEDTHTVQKQFYTCLEKSSRGEKITLEDLEQAFDIEKVSKEFFEKYKILYNKLCTEIKKICELDSIVKKDFTEHNVVIEDFAKKTLGQIVFLYFIQKKGWLGVPRDKDWGLGDKKFLRNLFEKKYCEYKNFFNDVLEHLFYEALATDRGPGAWFDKLNCRIPFLNGGLFEPVNGYEYEKTDLNIDNNLFKEIFDTFDLYNFTVKEDEPLEKEVAIDPEMLGKVFENLLPENIRKGNGAFYTPREIVHYMCQESLINYLYNKVNIKEVPISKEEHEQQLKLLKTKKEKEQLKLTQEILEEMISKKDIEYLIKKGESNYSNRNIKEELPESIINNASILDEALADIKVCDPAIGSGAFPVGIMNEIVRARVALNEHIGQNYRSVYELKRNAIENSIYGVDIDPGAVEIAKLRFWLSLVVDEDDIKNIKPLPNLEYKIMQGNSLITSYEGIDFDEIVDKQEKSKQLDLFASKSEKLTAIISDKQHEFLKTPYATRKSEIKYEIENLIVELVKTKFEEKAEKEGKQKDFYEEKIRNFAQNKENRNFFPWKLFFADAFENGGFDVVIGNPPYGLINKRQNKTETIVVTEEEYEYYKKNSKYFVATTGSINIFRLFIVQSLELLKANGIFSEIFPLAFIADLSAKKLRENILNNHCITSIEAFPERDNEAKRVFKSAKVSACIVNIQKEQPQGTFFIRTNAEPYVETIKEKVYLNYDKIQMFDSVYYTIPLLTNKDIELLSKVFNNSTKLENFAHCYTGEIDLSLNVNLLSLNNNYCEMIKGAIIDRYIKRKKMSQGEIMYLKDQEYLKNNTSKKSKHHNNKRIVMQGITGVNEKHRLKMTIIPEGIYCANSVNYIIFNKDDINIYSVLGILNSKLLDYVFKKFSTNSNVNGYEVDSLPINISNELLGSQISSIVHSILNITKADDYEENKQKQQTVKQCEDEIDNIVYNLYGLNEEEKLIIDPERLLNLKFDHKPTAKEIVEKIAIAKPSLMDNDRAFCHLFDKIAMNNSWQEFELPSYWTIGRTIYNYKKDNNIKASISAPTKSKLVNKVDLNNPMLKTYKFEMPKPSIKQIIAKIAEYDDYLFDNDRKLVELFDGIALTNGYKETELPKYWNIIRAMFDYKKEAKADNILFTEKE